MSYVNYDGNWHARRLCILSNASKIVLVKSKLTGIPQFCMKWFKIHVCVAKLMEQIKTSYETTIWKWMYEILKTLFKQ